MKNAVLKISQNSQESCARVSFLNKVLWHRCFLVNFVKFSKTPFLKNTYGRLLLLGPWQRSDTTVFIERHLPGGM